MIFGKHMNKIEGDQPSHLTDIRQVCFAKIAERQALGDKCPAHRSSPLPRRLPWRGAHLLLNQRLAQMHPKHVQGPKSHPKSPHTHPCTTHRPTRKYMWLFALIGLGTGPSQAQPALRGV